MFGLVTKAQLEEHRRELSAEIASCRKLQEEVAYEWAKWFNKFRSLYAMLLKREAATSARTPGEASSTADSPVETSQQRGNPLALELLRKRRG